LEPVNRRPGLLTSTLIHVIVITVLLERTLLAPTRPVPAGVTPDQAARATLLAPPAALLRELARPARPVPATPPPPPQAQAKDRISIGPPSTERQKGPLILRRDDDLTAVPRGKPQAQPSAQAVEPRPASTPAPAPSAGGSAGLRLPRGGDLPQPTGTPGAERRSIASSLRNLDQRIAAGAAVGIPTGTGQQMGPLFFDPEGADFTAWIQHFKNEVYRNWIVPEPALMGFKGHVELEFAVERDGQMNELRLLQSAGTPALDRAARNALVGSRFMPLPSDFGPPRVTMRVIFFYNEGPGGS
jgi:TonB family protein